MSSRQKDAKRGKKGAKKDSALRPGKCRRHWVAGEGFAPLNVFGGRPGKGKTAQEAFQRSRRFCAGIGF
jgi:hypothetical protein